VNDSTSEDAGDDSGSEEQEEVVEELDGVEEIMEILNKRTKGDKDQLQVKWNNEQCTWEPAEFLKIDVPEMGRKFYENIMQETVTPSRKARVKFTVETVGGCLSEHNSGEMFVMEDDPRYWNKGLLFNGVTSSNTNRRPILVVSLTY
jgi:septum formation topological specificity factor MinE